MNKDIELDVTGQEEMTKTITVNKQKMTSKK